MTERRVEPQQAEPWRLSVVTWKGRNAKQTYCKWTDMHATQNTHTKPTLELSRKHAEQTDHISCRLQGGLSCSQIQIHCMPAKLAEWEIIVISGAVWGNHHNNRRNEINFTLQKYKLLDGNTMNNKGINRKTTNIITHPSKNIENWCRINRVTLINASDYRTD